MCDCSNPDIEECSGESCEYWGICSYSLDVVKDNDGEQAAKDLLYSKRNLVSAYLYTKDRLQQEIEHLTCIKGDEE